MALPARPATILKLLGIAGLVLLLQIPLWLIHGLRAERAGRRAEAIAEITRTWGRDQQITGPFLVIPYRSTTTLTRATLINGRQVESTETRPVEKLAVFLPVELTAEGRLEPERRHRGIYETVVYTARLRLKGRFAAPDLIPLGLDSADMLWARAYLALGVDDLRGARAALAVSWNGQPHPFGPGPRLAPLTGGVHAPLPPLTPGMPAGEFTCELPLNGSGRLTFAPVGDQTTVRLASPWADPGFTGALLPAERELGPAGFVALWQASYYAREYARQWSEDRDPPSAADLADSAFGVELVEVVDAYRLVERATKYGLLFVVLLFTAFFLFEVLAALRLHVVHYTLVGAALLLFYLALLALAEFVPFHLAYAGAAAATTALISLHSVAILRSGARSLVIAAALVAIYGFLFFVLNLQDYALLAGTAALCTTLGVVMFATRKIDWAGTSSAPTTPPPLLPKPVA
jgi:inner membrane protein